VIGLLAPRFSSRTGAMDWTEIHQFASALEYGHQSCLIPAYACCAYRRGMSCSCLEGCRVSLNRRLGMKMLFSAAVCFTSMAPVAAQILYMDSSSGMLRNGFGVPVGGPSSRRVLEYNTTPSWRRNYIQPNGSINNGYGITRNGPNPRLQMCLQYPALC